MKLHALACLGALSGAQTWVSAHAQSSADFDRRFYAGVDLGSAELNSDWPAYFVDPARDRKSPGWKLRFGYQFSPRFALEAAYIDFGDYDGSGVTIAAPDAPSPPPMSFAPGDYRTSAKAIGISAVTTWPLGESLFVDAYAGILRREVTSLYDATLPGLPGFRAKDGDLGTQFGAGIGYRLSDSLDLGVNWIRTHNLEGDAEFLENAADPSMTSLGLRIRF